MVRLNTIFSLSERSPHASEAYIALLAAARNPFFFENLGVPDTLDGRFELIVLHLALMHRRLTAINGSEDFLLGLTEAFFADMDRALREMGVLHPGRRIKRMGDAYAGRLHAYGQSLQEREQLKSALARNLYGTVTEGDVTLLDKAADCAVGLSNHLSTTEDEVLLAGGYAWPSPETFAG